MIATIPNTPKVSTIVYRPKFSAVCSVGRAPFYGVLEIKFKPEEKLLEFESFEKWLRSLAEKKMTVEDLARLVFDEITIALGIIPLSVTVNAETTVHGPASALVERG
jgi:NADPH-dependent 7-cyano-7-deazaguanine reductase QueF